MNFQIVTVANQHPKVTHPHADYFLFDEFLASARRFGHEPLVLGWDEPWGGLATKPTLLKRAIDDGRVSGDVICFCDCYDLAFGADPADVAGEVIARIPSSSILFNAEKNLFPAIVPAEDFPEVGTEYRFLNSGLSIGHTADYLTELVAMDADNITEDIIGGPDGNVHFEDQSEWQLRYCYGTSIELDSECRWFQTLHGATAEEFDFTGEKIMNRATGTCPDIWHFNGNGKDNGIAGPVLEKLGL